MANKRYSQRLRLERPADATAGDQDPDTGVFDPDADVEPIVVYDNRADVQDAPAAVRRGDLGLQVPDADAVVYLLGRHAVAAVREGDTGVITWDDPAHTQQACEVAKVRRLDDSLELRFIGQGAVA